MKSKFLRLLAIVLCFATLATFVACNGGGDQETEQTTETTIGATEGTTEGTTAGTTEGTTEGTTDGTTEGTTEEKTEFVEPEMTVEEADGVATVTTTKGLTYTVSGYEKVNDTSFVFYSGLEFEFSADTFSEKFNRLTLNYRSNAPVHIYVTYKNHIGEETVADFFVEKGEGDFSGLILDYLDKRTATSITKIVVDTCENKKASFTLYHVSTEKIECYTGSYGNTKYYINNGRFKLGVDMSWGGAICYIADLSCDIEGLDNLVNKADEGRLIQQSYYGTPTIPGVYEPGEFNGSQWNYNPVQGGDKYGNDSRIIDIVVTDNSIYIKGQPQDWSLNGAITPSYMENWYILHDDHIEVKNRFVDFSGWNHPVTTQEIPAFYTVSYLDTFVWYDGIDPWTGGELSYEGSLNFWGDSRYAADCTFTLRQSNTEAWCAWVNATTNYGMGVYVPNADVFLAGRNAYNGTMDPDDGACGYVAPLKKLKLVSYDALEYSYMIATGTVDEIRNTFTENKDFATNEALEKNSVSMRHPDGDLDLSDMDFANEKYCGIFTNPNNTTLEYDATEQALKCTVTGGDPYAAIEFGSSQAIYNADNYGTIEVVYMIPTTNSTTNYIMELFLSAGTTTSAVGGKSVTKPLVADGEYHTLTIDVSGLAFWSGTINQIRFDYFSGAAVDDVIYVKSIELK